MTRYFVIILLASYINFSYSNNILEAQKVVVTKEQTVKKIIKMSDKDVLKFWNNKIVIQTYNDFSLKDISLYEDNQDPILGL